MKAMTTLHGSFKRRSRNKQGEYFRKRILGTRDGVRKRIWLIKGERTRSLWSRGSESSTKHVIRLSSIQMTRSDKQQKPLIKCLLLNHRGFERRRRDWIYLRKDYQVLYWQSTGQMWSIK